MKIGIITFHCANNYGAVLQAYGLQQYLKSLGHSVSIINYTPKYKLDNYKIFNPKYWLSRNLFKCFIRFLTECIVKVIRIKRWYAFDTFRKLHFVLAPYTAVDDYSNFDAVLIGSDQVWNPKLTGGDFDGVFFGVGFNTRLISYAASAKFVNLNDAESRYFMSHLIDFRAVSVRETGLKEMLCNLTDKPISVVLDPTLLAGTKIFNQLPNLKTLSKRYVLIYEIHRHRGVYNTAKRIASSRGIEIVELVHNPILPKRERDQSASPDKFVSYFKNAEFVVTTSFHGLAFAIMYNKDFYAIMQNNSADDRLWSLLNICKLQSRFIPMENNEVGTSIDYTKVNKILNEEREKSEAFLLNALL